MIFKYWNQKNIKLIVGAGETRQKGFIATDIDELDIAKRIDWIFNFRPESLSVVLAEHVLEHLTLEECKKVASLVFKYLKPGGVFRIAIPDKNRKDKEYVNAVRPPSDGHVIYLNLTELSTILKRAGFEIYPLEYHDSRGKFHRHPWKVDKGLIKRSFKYDRQKRFWKRKYYYTSLIIDAVKPVKK